MSYFLIKDGKTVRETTDSLKSVLQQYSDMYKYAVYIGGGLVYVVEKNCQKDDWEVGWAE